MGHRKGNATPQTATEVQAEIRMCNREIMLRRVRKYVVTMPENPPPTT